MAIRVCRMISHQQKGCIVMTSSAAALMPSPFVSLYGATKAFLSSFGASLAAEVRVLLPIGHVVGLPSASDGQHVQSFMALPSSIQNSNAGAVRVGLSERDEFRVPQLVVRTLFKDSNTIQKEGGLVYSYNLT
jgi:hypothetical protein